MRLLVILAAIGLLSQSCDCTGEHLLENIPETESWQIPTLDSKVHVIRTEMNIPHIYASNELDLYRVQGFVMAQDRYVQFELGRRFGQGRVSELLGATGLAIDLQSRGRGMRYISERLWTAAKPNQRNKFEAFAQGINAFIKQVHKGALPIPSELATVGQLIGVSDPSTLMKEISGSDVMGMAAVIISQLGYESTDPMRTQIENQLPNHFENAPLADLRQAGLSKDLWEPLGPIRPNSSAITWGLETQNGTNPAFKTQRKKTTSSSIPRSLSPLPTTMVERIRRKDRAFEAMIGHQARPEFGSNAWAISNIGTQSGGSILSGDGHLPLSVPSLFYQMCLDTSYLGESDFKLCGLFFPGLPFMSVGTNGFVAWSQTYLNGDITDWYQEEIQLDSNGLPSKSKFKGEWRQLRKIEEIYTLQDPTTEEKEEQQWARWTTFDGRIITSIEGTSTVPYSATQEGQSIVTMLGDFVIPKDTNGDGIIHALSFDWTAFDINATLDAVENFSYAKTVTDFRKETKKLVAYAQNIIVADRNGDILYTPYNATPCRNYLPKDASGNWVAGANPMRLLDGTQYGGFEIPVRDDGVVENSSQGLYRCSIPFDDIPQALSPQRGYVYTANNDIAGVSLDRSLSNDLWYFAGPFDIGYRAELIENELKQLTSQRSANLDSVSRIQDTHTSPIAMDLGSEFLSSISQAKDYSINAIELTPTEARVLALYQSYPEAIDEVFSRINTWIQRGALAESGVTTFYNQVSTNEALNAVATMIFNTWVRHLFVLIFDDENIDFLWEADGDRIRMRALHTVLTGDGPDNPHNLASWNPQTQESVFIDIQNTEIVESKNEILLQALINAIKELRSSSSEAGVGGFGTEDMSKWLWGLRHQAQFDSLLLQLGSENILLALLGTQFSTTTKSVALDTDIEENDPRHKLVHFPRPGDFFGVDAAHPGLVGNTYFYTNGPVMRMTFELTHDQVLGRNILPGGQSGYKENPNATDQLKKWLGNQTLPVHYYLEDALSAAIGRETFTP